MRNWVIECTVLLMITISSAFAADTLPVPSAWKADIPTIPNKFDWVLLQKGELLAGDLVAMYQEEIEFDSDEVGLVDIDMDDIRELRTRQKMSVRFKDGIVRDGQLWLTESTLMFIDVPDKAYPREMVLSISPSKSSEQGLWDGEVGAGFKYKSGNSESLDYTFSAKARYLSAHGRFLFNYRGVVSESANTDSGKRERTEDNHRINGSYDIYHSEQIYFRLPTYEFYRDEFKNIDSQTTLGASMGYEMFDNSDYGLDVYSGFSLLHTKYNSVEVGENKHNLSPVLAFGLDYDLDITKNLEYFLQYDGKVVNKESGRFIQHLETGIEIELVDDLDLEIAAIIDNTSDPIADEDGVKPDKTDVLMVIEIDYNF
jgi:putative salt-induced outer membrane protein YdiY